MAIFKKALVSALVLSTLSPTNSYAQNVNTVLRYTESLYSTSGALTISHPASVECNFKSTCVVPLTLSLSITSNSSSSYAPSYALIDYEAVDSNGRIVTPYGIWDYVMLDNGKSKTKELSFAYKGPTQIKFRWASGNTLKTFVESSSIISVIEITGQTQASYDAEVAAAAKAAADQAAADAAATRLRESAAQAAKKLTITCTKGKISKRVIGDPPSCPAGFKNSLSSFSTFQAYSGCRLYKKDSVISSAQLLDSGKTLTLSSVGKYSYTYNALTIADLACTLVVLKAPSFVTSQIDHTRALDGMQRATWGKISAFWTYHPDDGVNISFNSK
jgi:hypothetical protein